MCRIGNIVLALGLSLSAVSVPVPVSAATTIGKSVADYMVKTWYDPNDDTCGTKCFSLNYATVPATPSSKGWEYTYGMPISALWKLYQKTGNTSYHDYVKRYVDKYVLANGSIPTSLSQDALQPTVLLPGIYDETKDARYLTAMTTVRKTIDTIQKNTGGAFWHKPSYSNQQWLDGIYMTEPFLATYASKYANTVKSGDADVAFKTVTDQFILVHNNLYNSTMKLHYHAWLGSSDMVWNGINKFTPAPFTGKKRTDFFWGRSIGWYFISLMDVLEVLPTTNANYTKLVEISNLLAQGIVAQQDATTGLWYQILDVRNDKLPANGGYSNESIAALPNWLETSASALFTYGLSKGMRMGVLPCTMRAATDKAWAGVKSKVVVNGTEVTVKDTVVGMGVAGTYNSYVNADFRSNLTSGNLPRPSATCDKTFPAFTSIPTACHSIFVRDNVPQGVGAVMLASSEMEYSLDALNAKCPA